MASSNNDPANKVSPYSLQRTQQEAENFRSKADDIFGSLGGLEQKYADGLTKRGDEKKRDHVSDDEEEKDFKKPCPPKQAKDRGHESSFSQRRDDRASERRRDLSDNRQYGGSFNSRDRGRGRFSRPYNRQSRTPDYKVHPEKWQKYSLEDTCMYGDSFNRNVAVDFISELRKRKAEEKDSDEGDGSSESSPKIEFHKPTTSKDAEDDSNKRKNYGQVYRMDEYVVGMNKKPKSRQLPKANTASSSDDKTGANANLSLGHLAEGEEMEIADPKDSSKIESVVDTNQSEGRKDSNQPIAAADVEADEKDSQNKPDEAEKIQFKSGKGKGKRKIRRRQSDDDD